MRSALLEGRRVLLTGGSGFIGTNFVELMQACGAEVLNADLVAPLDVRHKRVWSPCDVGLQEQITAVVGDFEPDFVVHLAARTDTESDNIDDYSINWIGTTNLAEALRQKASLERFVFVSTQFVLGPGEPFKSETSYAPHTAYGESKARAEQSLRQEEHLPAVIVRPTNIWGPWHLRYQREFWRVLQRGLYLHPSSPDPLRSYGYVGSVCLQILATMLVSEKNVVGRALYVGDWPVRLSEWVDSFSMELQGRAARRVPGNAIRVLASTGDLMQSVGFRAPLTSKRFQSMTQDYPTPMELTEQALGNLPVVALDYGVRETVSWLRHGEQADVVFWLSMFPPTAEAEKRGL